MQGNFSYHNPTKLYFGDESLNYLKDELKNYGPVVMLNYGGSSIKKACEDLKAAYPDVNWKEGKLLNRASKQELETWVKGL